MAMSQHRKARHLRRAEGLPRRLARHRPNERRRESNPVSSTTDRRTFPNCAHHAFASLTDALQELAGKLISKIFHRSKGVA